MVFVKQKTTEERFWDHVDKTGECWEWTSSLTQSGYGRFALTTSKTVRAHRMSFELTRGEIPDGLHVLHRCDNRCCVRPDHLFLGTDADNIRDRDEKGRHNPARGGKHGSARLTADQVREIRAARADGQSLQDIAEVYGITDKNVSLIARRKTWRHI